MNESISDPRAPGLSAQTTAWLAALMHRNVDVAVIFLTPAAVVADWLGAAERLFGHTREAAIGLPFATIFTEEDLALGLDKQELALAASSGRSEDDRWHVRKNGGRFWGSGVLTAIRASAADGEPEGDVVALCKIVRDRTDIRAQILALENQVVARTEEIASRDRVSVAVAHELLNPMMPIMSAVGLLQNAVDDRMRERACEIIARQVGVLKGLIDDLNDSARTGFAPALITPERVCANDALRESAEGLRSSAESQGLALQVILPEQPIWIDADPLRLQQMLLNLIGNAIKYTSAGGRVALSVTVEGDMAVIRVEDDGRGIAPDVIPRIFELFTREERGVAVPGMGVGLAVVQDLARRHGGSAEVRSPGIGLGSIFALRLPLSGDLKPTPSQEAQP